MAKNLRQDITGLRAIAVLAVTLFHIDHVMLPQINIFKGGFLGVDIFFVISGFLMTMLIMRKGGGLQSGDFSLLKFYQRRAKRICPALIATIVFFLVLGYFIFSPEDLKNAGREAGKAVLFISNEYFAKRAGYFDTVATDKLFLHTWVLYRLSIHPDAGLPLLKLQKHRSSDLRLHRTKLGLCLLLHHSERDLFLLHAAITCF